MLDIDHCIQYWKIYLDQNESRLTAHQHQVILSTMKHLAEYKKLQKQVKPQLTASKEDK